MAWYPHLFKNFPQFVVIHTVKDFTIVNEADVFLNFLAFLWANKLWKILKEIGIPDHLTWLLKILYAGQETTVRTGHGTTYWSKIENGVCQGYILSPFLFNLYVEYIMWNARLDESQAGIKIAGRNINNLRYGDHTTLVTESKEELKSLLMHVKEENENVG